MHFDRFLPRESMERIHQRFERLYGDLADRCTERIEMLIGRYGIGLTSSHSWYPPDETMSVLMTDGCAVTEEGERPLQTLSRVLCDHFDGSFSCVHVLPFYAASSKDHLAVTNHREVDPALGTWNDLASIGRSFSLSVDLVLACVSKKGEWFRDYADGVAPHRHFFHDVRADDSVEAAERSAAGGILRSTQTPNGERWVWATYDDDRVDLNFTNPDVLFEFLDIIFLLISKGARVLRLDGVATLWKRPGTPCVHLDECGEIVGMLRDLVDWVAPGTQLIVDAEFRSDQQHRYVGSGSGAHMIYDLDLVPALFKSLSGGDASSLRRWADSRAKASLDCVYLNLTSSHDGVGAWSSDLLDVTGSGLRQVNRVRGSLLNALTSENDHWGGCLLYTSPSPRD